MQTLKAVRESKGVKKGAVADAMGVSFPTYQRYEDGETAVPAQKLYAACEFLGVDVASIDKEPCFFTLEV